MTTLELRDAVERAGYQFLKDKSGWACYDADDRLEVPGTRHKMYGESVAMAAGELRIGAK